MKAATQKEAMRLTVNETLLDIESDVATPPTARKMLVEIKNRGWSLERDAQRNTYGERAYYVRTKDGLYVGKSDRDSDAIAMAFGKAIANWRE